MKSNFFKKSDLIKREWQYINDGHFNIGDSVFLKSNPEIPMKVYYIKENTVGCYYSDTELGSTELPRECLLHYNLRSLRVYLDKYFISLN